MTRCLFMFFVLWLPMVLSAQPEPIPFENAIVKQICVSHWDTDGDHELSYDEAAAVTTLGKAFASRWDINGPFQELRYFLTSSPIRAIK